MAPARKTLKALRDQLHLLDSVLLLALGIGLLATAGLTYYYRDRAGIVLGTVSIIVVLGIEWFKRPIRREIAANETGVGK